MCALPAELDLARDARVDAMEQRLPLFRREVQERLSPTALELVLSRAEVLVEGATGSGRSAKGAFFGSAMLTLDLERCADRLQAPHDEAMATRLCDALTHDEGARRAVSHHALEIARARMSVPDDVRGGALRCRVDGPRLLVDLELESSR